MTIYRCRLTIAQGAASFDLLVDVDTNSTWRITRPVGWCPGSGRWNASERVGMGGSIYYGGGPRQTPIFRLNDFIPLGYERYRPGVVGSGVGLWLEPVMPVARDRPFAWVIDSVD